MRTPDVTDQPSAEQLAALTERPLQVSDAAQIAEIHAEMEVREPADLHSTEQEILEELQSPTVELAGASLGLFHGQLLVGYAAVSVLRDEKLFKAHLAGGVRTAWTRRGLGTRLVQRAQSQATAWRDRDAPGLPGEFGLWAEEKRISMIALAQSLGYETWRYFFRMQRDLTKDVEPAPAPAGFELRSYTAADSEPARQARNRAFQDHWGSMHSSTERWEAHMTGAEAFRPELSFLALFTESSSGPSAGSSVAAPGDVAGFLLCEEFAGETEARGFRTAYVALVGTVQQARGRGLASALLALQLQAARQAGYRYAELSVDSDSPTGAGRIYERSGFVEIDRNRVLGRHFS